jgi:hypothetical protein
MIGEYLPQTNESATVAEAKIFCKLNKALDLVTAASLQIKLKLGQIKLGQQPNTDHLTDCSTTQTIQPTVHFTIDPSSWTPTLVISWS